MPTFAYKARNTSGEAVNGTLVADTSAAAARALGELSLMPVEVSELKAERSFFSPGARRVRTSTVGQMYEQLADLLRAGVPALRAINVLTRQASSGGLARVLREVHDDVAGGETLADAMDKHHHAFSPLHVSMIRAGERGGFLEDVLSRLSEFVARQDALRNKFIGSMIYPSVLLLGAIGAVCTLMIVVVPQIGEVLKGQELPWATHVIFGISHALSTQYLTILGVVAGIVIATNLFFKSAAGQDLWARVQLRAWGVGKIYTMVSLCRFCRILGTLLANGIPILQSLRIAKDSTGNKILADTIDKAADNVSAGEPLVAPLAASKVFPPAMIDMIAVAEESNTLEKVLVEIANTQEERTARQIDLFVRLLEPMMLLVMGVMVMFIAIGLLLPIVNMATTALK